MDPSLFDAAVEGNTQSLLRLLGRDKNILARGAPTSADTPLHIAAMRGHLGFAKELINKYKGDKSTNYIEELNQDGFSAVHIAAANGHKEIVAELLNVSSQIVNLKGKDGMTPLHCACVKGRAAIVSHFLVECDNLEAVVSQKTVRGENALHLAVKNNQVGAFQILMEKIERENLSALLNSKDEEGNTILHLAAARRNRQIIQLLLPCYISNPGILQVNALNKSSLTALDVFLLVPSDSGYNDIESLLRDGGAQRARSLNSNQSTVGGQLTFLPSSGSPRREGVSRIKYFWRDYFKFHYEGSDPNKVRSDLLVVVTLLATATFQAGLSPPGGMDDETGVANLVDYDRKQFMCFVVFNSLGFFTSLNIIVAVTRNYPMVWDLYIAIIGVMLTYTIGVAATMPTVELGKIVWVVLMLAFPSIYFVSYRMRKCLQNRRMARN